MAVQPPPDAASQPFFCCFPAGKWVTTNTTGNKYELAYTRAATRLIKYFKGGNDNSTSMDLTTPTVAQLAWTEDGQGTDQNYTFGLWIPKDYQVRGSVRAAPCRFFCWLCAD